MLPEVQEKKIQKTKLNVRDEILNFEAEMKTVPGVMLGDNNYCPLKHSFADGIYTREMFIPKGTLIVGKIHKDSCQNIILSGDITVVSEEGKKRIKGPHSFVSPPGVKRIGYAHEDTVWINVHQNPDNETDLKKIEERVIAKDYSEFENTQIEGKTTKKINQNNMENKGNCGLYALKNLDELKSISIKAMVQMAEDNGLEVYPYKVPKNELSNVPFPAIFHTDNHFVYVPKKEEFDSKLTYSGNVLLTKEADYPKIKASEQKKVTGGSWAAVIAGGVAVTTAGIGYVKDSEKNRTLCEKDCKATCKASHKAIGGGRRKCIKECRAACVQDNPSAPPAEQKKGVNWFYVTAAILVVGAIILFIFRKKLKF